MYYFQCYMSVHFRSGLMDIKGISRNELPRFLTVMREEGYLLLPVLLLVLRLVIGRSPSTPPCGPWPWPFSSDSSAKIPHRGTATGPCGRPGLRRWGTDMDRAGAGGTGQDRPYQSESPREEVEAEYRRIVAEALAAPRHGFSGDWMLAAGAAVFAILMAVGFTLGFASSGGSSRCSSFPHPRSWRYSKRAPRTPSSSG